MKVSPAFSNTGSKKEAECNNGRRKVSGVQQWQEKG